MFVLHIWGPSQVSSDGVDSAGLAGRYATALYDLADEGQVVDAVVEDLRTLQEMIAESEDLTRLVRSPVISIDEQAGAMNAVLTRAGAQDLVTKFVNVVARNRRLFVLPKMISAFLAIHARRRGEVSAQVTSPKTLSDQQLGALSAALKQAVGSDVTIDAKVDPALLGGLVIRVGSRMIDSSVRTKLQHLRLVMKGIG